MAQPVTPSVLVYENYEIVSRAAAAAFVDLSNEVLARKDRFTVALSGGSTPRRLYQILASDYIDKVEWERVVLYWTDERYVPQRDPRSNFRMFHESLLHHIPIPLGNVYPMPTHRKEAVQAAIDYELFMRSEFAGEWPEIDLILLGMGDDGHMASVFPGSPALEETRRWVIAVEVPVEPSVRLTFTLPVINSAADVCFLVSGKAKAPMLGQVLAGPVDAMERPASAVHPNGGRLIWRVDREAASRVKRSQVSRFRLTEIDGGTGR